MEGDWPDRPALGFPDALWESLATTWVEEDGPESRRRPSASTVLDWLKERVDDWGESVAPLVPKQWQENGRYPEYPNK